jgi:hypothetical protein
MRETLNALSGTYSCSVGIQYVKKIKIVIATFKHMWNMLFGAETGEMYKNIRGRECKCGFWLCMQALEDESILL